MRDYFCGWYFKCQSKTQTIAVIPAFQRCTAQQSCSIQLITDDGAFNIQLPYKQLIKNGSEILIGENSFGPQGIRLCLHTPLLCAAGTLRFGSLTPIRYDIMGPFRFMPFMECRHSVFSMKHSVSGSLDINGRIYDFENALGYIEGDRGTSFPKEYAWTQSFFKYGSLMLSVADIPIGLFRFTGIIGVIHYKGREYRLATYLGAMAVKIEKGEIVIRQGNSILCVRLIEKKTQPLFAPVNGSMSRTIHESAACRASYSFKTDSRELFCFETSRASFEYEYRR